MANSAYINDQAGNRLTRQSDGAPQPDSMLNRRSRARQHLQMPHDIADPIDEHINVLSIGRSAMARFGPDGRLAKPGCKAR